MAIALNSFTSYAQTCQLLGTVSGPEDVPVEYVTIEIYEDSSFLWGTISKEDGGFSIEDLQCGSTYHLKARYFGYQTVEQEFTAQTNASPLALRLQVDSKELDEIVVSEKRPTIERKADRLIYFVNQSFVAGKNSAFDVLKTTPSVWIDNNGLIRINGKAGTRVMINGKMLKVSGMELQNYLNGIEGKDIIKIEVIAMPGSEFDAESKGGVINIELRKRFLDGYNARLFAGGEQGRYPEYSTGIFSNYKKG
ncbi:MAG: carboxypeptidase regulatory-like domain-containing protein, partial [Bacteroidota bacterium]